MGMVTMHSCSNEKYRRMTSKESRTTKKTSQGIAPQASKKNSLNTFLTSTSKLKSSGNIL